MRKRIALLLCLIVVMALFSTTAFAASSVAPFSTTNTGVAWSSKRVDTSGGAIVYDVKDNSQSYADIYIGGTAYSFTTGGLQIQLYDFTDRVIAAPYSLTKNFRSSTSSYDYVVSKSYLSGMYIEGHQYALQLKLPEAANVGYITCNGKFYA